MKKVFALLLVLTALITPSTAKASTTFTGGFGNCASTPCTWNQISPNNWDGIQNFSGNNSLVNFGVFNESPTHSTIGRFTVRPGDVVALGERTEVYRKASLGHKSVNGDVDVTTFDVKFPSGWWDTFPSFAIFTQWHDTSDSCSPPVDLRLNPDGHLHLHTFHVTTRSSCAGTSTDTDLGAVSYDTWITPELTVHWSTSASTGSVSVKINGTTYGPAGNLATLPSDFPEVYLKQGLYRAPLASASNRVVLDNTVSVHN